MGLEELRQEILSKAKEQADNIIKSAELSAKNIVNEVKREIGQYKTLQNNENKKKIESKEHIITASANATSKYILMQKKKEIIDGIFEEAKNQLTKQRKNKGYIEKLIRKAEKEIEIKLIYCNKADINEIRKYPTKESDITAGIIAENEDGTVKVDFGFDTISEDIKAKTLGEVAKVLFNEK